MDQETFNTNKYIFVKDAIPKELCNVLTDYTLMKQLHEPNKSTDISNTMMPDTHEKYGDHAMEALLINLLPTIEKYTELTLYPTYSFYRVYKPGDVLFKHADRPSCEISVSLTLGYEYDSEDENYVWGLWAGDTEFKMSQGDMLIYKGLEVPHWREPFNIKNGWQSQVFLHYVDADGLYADLINDARPNVGYPEWVKNPALISKAAKLQKALSNKDV